MLHDALETTGSQAQPVQPVIKARNLQINCLKSAPLQHRPKESAWQNTCSRLLRSLLNGLYTPHLNHQPVSLRRQRNQHTAKAGKLAKKAGKLREHTGRLPELQADGARTGKMPYWLEEIMYILNRFSCRGLRNWKNKKNQYELKHLE